MVKMTNFFKFIKFDKVLEIIPSCVQAVSPKVYKEVFFQICIMIELIFEMGAMLCFVRIDEKKIQNFKF